ncbi:uncharacterized protein K460DRAFT_435489 [Cucurbitaria berberidis CBS 394.84]|uniref:Uncharacterized protein n=1 Tax=Cucurbitaria berberidis CBS 394.84 TaxID=1168544 RepID=A0A9P4GB23_9PLEO|nr:uncharacterized protein K460DRAFT_435489 [Cucurbitaria berberidis CBS 394.84]KAF1842157.1 hypothetical protein K460DRAFT_435489 [Cucurbitaria berberidis CBS 394.84]
MRPSEVEGTPMDVAPGFSFEDVPLWTLNRPPIHGAMNHSVYPQPRYYPAITTHYGECAYMIDECSSSSERYLFHNLSSAVGSHSMKLDSSSHATETDTTSAKVLSGYNTAEDEYVSKQNLKLSKELHKARGDLDYANKTLRDLAAWAYHERGRLLQELVDAQVAHEHQVKEGVVEEEAILTQPSGQTEWIGKRTVAAVEQDMNHGEYGSITDQVDALIAEEKGNLPALE